MISLWVVGLIISNMGVLQFQSGYCDEIIGGEVVKPHSLPHMAMLINKSGDPFCGGTLISSRWVLTAAHCEGIMAVKLGVHSMEMGSNVIHRNAEKSYPHPCYMACKRTPLNDIMLLKLNKAVKETETVKYLPVPKTPVDPEPGSRCLVAGWGVIDERVDKMSDVLKAAYVTVVDRMKCNSEMFYNQDPVITENMLCAGYTADTCKGDSGGPIQCNGTLVGITSFGKGCGVFDKPGVYTFLSKEYIEWINTLISK